MSERDPLESLGRAWRAEGPGEALPWVAPEALDRRARELERQVAWRNVREWVAAGLVVVLFGFGAVTAERWLSQIGCAWTAMAGLWVAWMLLRRGGNLPRPPVDAPTGEWLRYERSQLERQARLLERVPTWYVLPLAIGTGLILADRVRLLIERAAPPSAFMAVGIVVVVVLGVYLAVLVANRRAARALRTQAEKLLPDS